MRILLLDPETPSSSDVPVETRENPHVSRPARVGDDATGPPCASAWRHRRRAGKGTP